MTNRRITIQLKGDPADSEHLRLSDFITQLEAIRGALTSVEESITGSEKKSVYYRVVDLRHSSPATIVLDAVPLNDSVRQDVSSLVVDSFVGGMKQVLKGVAPKGFGYEVLESFKKIAAPLKRRVSSITLESDDGITAEVTKEIESRIDTIVGPDEVVRGSIAGTLEYFNIHAGANNFRIYPIVGPKRVDCHFPRELFDKALSGVSKYVNVEGELRYKSAEPYAYAVNVTDIEVFPDEEQLPSILDIRGIAPSAIGSLTSEEFVREIRDAKW